MGGKNYYLILGVARSESPAGIRARYRDLVRTLHPDVAGAQSTGAFRDVTEAYEVLADPQARRRHDTELDAWERSPPVEGRTMPVASWRAPPVSLLAEPLAVRPLLRGAGRTPRSKLHGGGSPEGGATGGTDLRG